MPPEASPLQLVLTDIGDQQLAKGSSSADPGLPLSELEGRMNDKTLKAGEQDVTRIRITGEKARTLCPAGAARAPQQRRGRSA